MKFSINRSKFVEQLNNVQFAISSRSTIPVLSGIKLVAQNNQLILTGSDADISIEASIEVDEESQLEIEKTGSIVVMPARMLMEIVKKLPDETVVIELKESTQVSIDSKTSSFVINGIEADQYPHLPEIDADKRIRLPAQLFKQIIRQTVIAVSKHESRPILTGVEFFIENNQLTAVATDSHRLSRRTITLEESYSNSLSFVIPGKSLTELNRIISDDIESLDLYVTDSQVLFAIPQINFYSRLLEGNYPNTDQLIPSESNTKVILDADLFEAAVDRASLLSHAGKNNVIKLIIAEDHMEVFGDYPGIGQIEEDIPFKSIEGDSIEISFNPDYMKQALNAFGPVEVGIELIGALRPFIIKPSDGSLDFVQLITPIRTPE